MLKTEPTQYEVVGRRNNHLWIEVLSGGDQGIRVSVPVHHDDYDEPLQEKIFNLSVGDIAEIELKSDKEERPDWRISSIRSEADRRPMATI